MEWLFGSVKFALLLGAVVFALVSVVVILKDYFRKVVDKNKNAPVAVSATSDKTVETTESGHAAVEKDDGSSTSAGE